MPLTLTLSEGVLAPHNEPIAVQRLTQLFLRVHELTNNRVMTPNVTAQVVVIPEGRSYSGGQRFVGAWVEWKTPTFAFAHPASQREFGSEATRILVELADGRLTPDRVYFNVVHTVDGTWNLNGEAHTNDELKQALADA